VRRKKREMEIDFTWRGMLACIAVALARVSGGCCGVGVSVRVCRPGSGPWTPGGLDLHFSLSHYNGKR